MKNEQNVPPSGRNSERVYSGGHDKLLTHDWINERR